MFHISQELAKDVSGISKHGQSGHSSIFFHFVQDYPHHINISTPLGATCKSPKLQPILPHYGVRQELVLWTCKNGTVLNSSKDKGVHSTPPLPNTLDQERVHGHFHR